MDSHKFIPKARVVNRIDYLTEIAVGKKVLNIGMGGYIDNPDHTSKLKLALDNTLHSRLHSVASDVTGIDINPMAIEIMSEALPGRYVVTDITAPEAAEIIDDQFDLIIFGDVIEHLDCFRSALTNLRQLLGENGQLVISTANAYCAESILKYLFRYESVHEEHTCYFSYSTMKRLLQMNGLAMADFSFYLQPRKPDNITSWIGYFFLRFVGVFFPHFATGIIVHSKPH